MFSRMLSAALVVFVVGGFVLADATYRGRITAVSDTEVKITVIKKGEKTGEDKVFKKVAKEVKVSTLKKKEKTDSSVSDITKAISDSKGGKGVFGSVVTKGEGDKEEVVEINFTTGRKK